MQGKIQQFSLFLSLIFAQAFLLNKSKNDLTTSQAYQMNLFNHFLLSLYPEFVNTLKDNCLLAAQRFWPITSIYFIITLLLIKTYLACDFLPSINSTSFYLNVMSQLLKILFTRVMLSRWTYEVFITPFTSSGSMLQISLCKTVGFSFTKVITLQSSFRMSFDDSSETSIAFNFRDLEQIFGNYNDSKDLMQCRCFLEWVFGRLKMGP